METCGFSLGTVNPCTSVRQGLYQWKTKQHGSNNPTKPGQNAIKKEEGCIGLLELSSQGWIQNQMEHPGSSHALFLLPELSFS